MAHFIRCHSRNYASYIVELCLKELIKLYGVPRSLVSDRDTKFLSHFWIRSWRLSGTMFLFNTTCHSQISRQLKVTNESLSTFLRLVKREPQRMGFNLPHTDFAYNCAPTYTISHSLFEAYCRLNPLTPIDLLLFPLSIGLVLRCKRAQR